MRALKKQGEELENLEDYAMKDLGIRDDKWTSTHKLLIILSPRCPFYNKCLVNTLLGKNPLGKNS